jgi:hypothetical protein
MSSDFPRRIDNRRVIDFMLLRVPVTKKIDNFLPFRFFGIFVS